MDLSDRLDDLSQGGSLDIGDTFEEEELQEDDEIDDDAQFPLELVQGLLSHRSLQSHDSTYASRGEPESPQSSAKADRGGEPLKPKVGAIRVTRVSTRRKGASVDKKWGNASTPICGAISLKDIMGSEKNATRVGIAQSSHSRASRQELRDSRPGAEVKRVAIRTRKGAKKDRRKEVKNSLDIFIKAQQDEKNVEEKAVADEVEEDESLHSDIDDDALKVDNSPSSDDEQSVKSTRSHSRRRRPKSRRTTNTDEGGSSSLHSRKRGSRRRPLKVEADDATVGSSRRSPHTSRRARVVPEDGSRRRRTLGDRSVDAATRRHRGDQGKAEDGEENQPKARKTVYAEDADDRSVGSRKSTGRRRGQRSDPTRSRRKSSLPPSKDHKSRTAPGSPEVQPPERDENEVDKLASLSKHLESKSREKDNRDPEEESEESSRFSHGYNQSTTLLQFDPTNANNVTLVDQKSANITSGKITHADGTEAELHISELAGLPTFEVPPPTFHDSNSNFTDVLGEASQNSLGSIEYSEDLGDEDLRTSTKSLDNDARKPRSSKSLPSNNQKAGEKSEGDDKNSVADEEGGRPGRPRIKKTRSGGAIRGASVTRSFLQRGRRKQPEKALENADEFQDSQKGFFSGWKKKEKDESGSDEEPKGRFFKKREPKENLHQALDDDGSEED
jgi:hypothetical protein